MSVKEKNKANREANSTWSFRKLLSGELITNKLITQNLRFILYIVVWIMISMYNKFSTEKVINNINKTKQEVGKLKAISVANTAELMYLSKESVVVKMVDKEGLQIKPLRKPPEKLIVKQEESE